MMNSYWYNNNEIIKKKKYIHKLYIKQEILNKEDDDFRKFISLPKTHSKVLT